MRRFIATTVTALLLCGGMEAASVPVTPKNTPSQPVATAKTPRTNLKTAKPGEITGKAARKSARKSLFQIGKCSWYGKAFHGKKTASGERFDRYQFTAASKTIPIGSYVKVTNLRNDRWVVLRVNDRGPYVGNRILDVSEGAANMLELKARGVERVKVEPINPVQLAVADVSPI
jgi:rare lipoprotein A (peptidoglycan hydrolase)